VYGYSDGVAPWLFQIDDGTPEASSVLPDLPCRVLKDLQGLPNGNHRVVVTPQSISFVLTKFKYVSFNSSFHDPIYLFPQCCHWTQYTVRQPHGDKHDTRLACIQSRRRESSGGSSDFFCASRLLFHGSVKFVVYNRKTVY